MNTIIMTRIAIQLHYDTQTKKTKDHQQHLN